MSTSDFDATTYSSIGHSNAVTGRSIDRAPMHRLRAVRQEQGYTLRRVAQQMKMDIEEVRQEEDEYSDLPLSRLMEWQRVLEVPLVDLLVETESPLRLPCCTAPDGAADEDSRGHSRADRQHRRASPGPGIGRTAQGNHARAGRRDRVGHDQRSPLGRPLGRIVEQTYNIDFRPD